MEFQYIKKKGLYKACVILSIPRSPVPLGATEVRSAAKCWR